MKYITRVTEIAVLPEHETLTSEMTTHVRIVDEGAGEFVEVRQYGRADIGEIEISPDEWPALRETIDQMVALCQPERDGGRDG